MDGQEVPVNVTLKIAGIQKGEEADAYLSGKTPEKSISPDMEYIIVTLGITYNAGDLDEIYMEANDGTLPSAKLKFTLSNGDSNAEDIPHFYRVL